MSAGRAHALLDPIARRLLQPDEEGWYWAHHATLRAALEGILPPDCQEHPDGEPPRFRSPHPSLPLPQLLDFVPVWLREHPELPSYEAALRALCAVPESRVQGQRAIEGFLGKPSDARRAA